MTDYPKKVTVHLSEEHDKALQNVPGKTYSDKVLLILDAWMNAVEVTEDQDKRSKLYHTLGLTPDMDDGIPF